MLFDLSWILNRPRTEADRSSSKSYFRDPEYLSRYQQYINSLQSFNREVEEAVSRLRNQALPGPRRQVDQHRLNTLRRFCERDAYQYFSYRPHIRGPAQAATEKAQARGYAKDASSAMLLDNEGRAKSDLKKAQDHVEAACREAWESYRERPTPRSDDDVRRLVETLGLAQAAGLTSPTTEAIEAEISDILSRGGRI